MLDVADTIIAIIESPIENVGGKIFNVGHEDNNHTINHIGRLVKAWIPEAELIIEEREIDKRDYKVNFDRLKNTLNLSLNKKVSDGINEIKEFLENNPQIDYQDNIYSNIKFLEENGREIL